MKDIQIIKKYKVFNFFLKISQFLFSIKTSGKTHENKNILQLPNSMQFEETINKGFESH